MYSETVTIRDEVSGATAKILVGFGFNCFEFRVPVEGGMRDVLWSVPRFETGQERASSSGIPILFPFPGRIRGTELIWKGETFSLDANDGRGNAIHGFVHVRPWRVIEQSGSRVVGEFQASVDDALLRKSWPADFRITADYSVENTTLKTSYRIENPDDCPLPCGLGTHPYFCLPLGGTTADSCLVQLPVTESWELADMIPTGKRLAFDRAAEFMEGIPFGQLDLDNVFTGLRFENDRCRSSITDVASACKLIVSFDRAFRECVVYNPPHRQALCIEPYTCVPDAVRLAEQGIDSGLRVLAPGESLTANVEVGIQQSYL